MSTNPNISKVLDILEDAKEYISDCPDQKYYPFESPGKLIEELDRVYKELNNGDISGLKIIKERFKPAAAYSELASDNDWEEEYLQLVSDYSSLYHRIINTKPGKSLNT